MHRILIALVFVATFSAIPAHAKTRDALIDAQRAEIAELKRAVEVLFGRTVVDERLALTR